MSKPESDKQPKKKRKLTDGLRERLVKHLTILGSLLAVLWGVELVDYFVLGQKLNDFGIRPRTVQGLLYIPLSPFLHGDLSHLAANTLPLLVLGWLVMLRRVSDFVVVSVVSTLIGGLGIWLIGSSDTAHVGCSALIFGYFGYLVSRAYFERSLVSFLLAVVVVIFYGGMIWGVLPSRPEVSWEGHLSGLIGGIASAAILSKRRTALDL